MNKLIAFIVIIILVAAGIYLFAEKPFSSSSQDEESLQDVAADVQDQQEDVVEEIDEKETVIGTSVEGRDIVAYHYGGGEETSLNKILLIGGIHGGYGWNTSLLGYELMDFFERNSDQISSSTRVTIIPTLNPDGLHEIIGIEGRFSAADAPSEGTDTIPGRFNANGVDLNRNFECDWQSKSTWQTREVSGGSAAFSEPEAQAIRDYVSEHKPSAVVVYYAAAGGVFASNCHEGVLPDTTRLTELYAEASNYRPYQEFSFYDITGDMVNWLAKEGIPAISVLLTTHTDSEFGKNRAGVEALLEFYGDRTEDASEILMPDNIDGEEAPNLQ